MWKVSWFYEKVHNIANLGGYAAILEWNNVTSQWQDCSQRTTINTFCKHGTREAMIRKTSTVTTWQWWRP